MTHTQQIQQDDRLKILENEVLSIFSNTIFLFKKRTAFKLTA